MAEVWPPVGNTKCRILGLGTADRAGVGVDRLQEAVEPGDCSFERVAHVGGRLMKAVALAAVADQFGRPPARVEALKEKLGLRRSAAGVELAM